MSLAARAPDRAQLLYALAAGGRAAMLEAAEQMGYVVRPRLERVGQRLDKPAAGDSASVPDHQSVSQQKVAPTESQVDLVPLRFLRPVAREYRKALDGRTLPPSEPSTNESVQPEDLETETAAAHRHEPIVTWPQLWRALEDRLRTPRPRREIDTERLVTRWARGESVHALPRRTGLVLAPLTVVLDTSDRLMPFWRDQKFVLGKLARRLGRRAVRLVDAEPLLRGELPLLRSGERVLALTDLGSFASEEKCNAWIRLGAHLRRRSAAPPVALVTAPARLWTREASRFWQLVEWENPNRRGGLGATTEPGGAPSSAAVLARAAVAQRLEAGMVRGLRRLAGADLGAEVALWQHPDVLERGPGGLVLEPEALKRWRKAFHLLPDAEKVAVVRLLESWHVALPEILAAEIADLLGSGVGEEILGTGGVGRALPLLARICRRVARERDQDPAFELEVDAWFARLGQWSSLGLWREPRIRADLEQAVRAHRRRYPGQELPTGVTPESLAEEEDNGTVLRRWQVVHHKEGLAVEQGSSAGSPVAEITSHQAPVVLADGLGAARQLKPGVFETLSGVAVAHLATDVEAVTLEAWQPVLDDPTSWACAAGRDRHGLWAAFEVDGVRQRLRWIPPGRFWMGSPEQEAGHWDDEGPRHPVTLAEGFWLAETPRTQALWRAVMGKNPSRFKDDRRPVENVSWQDCQRFLDRLNERFRHLDARLPTEAEWEYACRAGTETATWLGDHAMATTGEAPRLASIAWCAANSGRETHEVGDKEANPWGLHDLLGNVWEWCWDREHRYSASPEHDPEGPAQGSERIIRGGSWNVPARYVRSAYRGWNSPDDRGSGLGFRLSRGRAPRARGAEKEPGGAVSGAARRGARRRAGARRSRAWVERLRWASEGGTDVFGRWASFEVGDVSTRLRWIVPGRFWMGSPAEEAGRYDDEGPRHEVTLTEGFWLADTPCTQALWQAVMGSNPSKFRSPGRPVENVSWNDTQRFLEKLNERVPGLEARLPSEAQWEHACRAGTETATWLGDLEILGERNAPRLDDIAWYGGNSGVAFDLPEGADSSGWRDKQYPHVRAGTRDVALKGPNPWGLYDMLGNVWEWCGDRWSNAYPEGPRIDPSGPEQGSYRVVRGGSWGGRARSVRAARRWERPGGRPSGLGFRLSRGPER